MLPSFYIQFLVLKNGQIEKYSKESHPQINNAKVTQIVTGELMRYGVQFNPCILDYMTVYNSLNVSKRFILELGVSAVLYLLTAGLLYLCKLPPLYIISISALFILLFVRFAPVLHRHIAEGIYLIYKIIIQEVDKDFVVDDKHVLFSLSGKITVKLNEYLLFNHCTDDCIIFTDELSVNDFVLNFTSYLAQKCTVLDKVRMCFSKGYKLQKSFINSKVCQEKFSA